jgi:hypothetical protein
LLQGLDNLGWVIPVVEQNRDFWDVDRLAAKVVEVVAQQFNQTLIVRYTCFGAVCEEWQSESIDGKMSLDAISTLVMAEPFRINPGIAGVFHRLRVDNQ